MRLDHLLSKEHERKFKASVSKGKQVERKHCSILRILKEKECLQKKLEKPRETRTWGCSSAGRAPALQAGGQEFDPPHLHHRASEDEETTTVARN